MYRVFFALLISLAGARADVVRIAGASSIALPISAATKVLGPELNTDFEIITQGGSDGGIESLGLHRVDVAMVIAPLRGSERAQYPDVLFTPTFIGRQALGLAVSDDLWRAGVQKLTREQLRKIYQKRIKNWKDVGGPDRKISFFDWGPDTGNWQMFGQWLYGDSRRTPQGYFPVVEDIAGAIAAVREHAGGIALVPLPNIDGATIHALQVPGRDDAMAEATPQNVAKDIYPINRPLFLITNDRPTGSAKELVTYLLGPKGQELMRATGYFPAAELKALGDPNAP